MITHLPNTNNVSQKVALSNATLKNASKIQSSTLNHIEPISHTKNLVCVDAQSTLSSPSQLSLSTLTESSYPAPKLSIGDEQQQSETSTFDQFIATSKLKSQAKALKKKNIQKNSLEKNMTFSKPFCIDTKDMLYADKYKSSQRLDSNTRQTSSKKNAVHKKTTQSTLLPLSKNKKTNGNEIKQHKLERMKCIVGPITNMINTIANDATDQEQLSVYRAMGAEEFSQLKSWMDLKDAGQLKEPHVFFQEVFDRFENDNQKGKSFDQIFNETLEQSTDFKIMGVRKHLGCLEMASEYHNQVEPNHLIEFKLKPGTHKLLFSPDCMAIQSKNNEPSKKLQGMFDYLRSQSRQIASSDQLEPVQVLQSASLNEGTEVGFIGVKSEEKKGGMSLSIGDQKMNQLLFQLFVDRVEVIGTPNNVQ